MSGSGIATIATGGTTPPAAGAVTLVDAMLETARVMGVVREGAATGGSTTTLIDTQLDEPAGYYTKGTVWALSGLNDGLCDVIKTFSENTITLTSTLTAVIASGIEYAVATAEYPKHKIKQAVLSALRLAPVLKTDDTLVVIANTEEYTLPTGVVNIKRVEVATSNAAPYGFIINHFWKEWNGKLVFDSGKEPTASGYIIRLWYEAVHGEIAETGSISTSIDQNWLKWAAAVFLYRDQIKKIQKDNPTNLDLLNEAKTLEAEAKRNAKKYQLVSMTIDPKLAGW
jgi:hypothetical protein